MIKVELVRYQIGPTHWRELLWPFELTIGWKWSEDGRRPIRSYALVVKGRWRFLFMTWTGRPIRNFKERDDFA